MSRAPKPPRIALGGWNHEWRGGGRATGARADRHGAGGRPTRPPRDGISSSGVPSSPKLGTPARVAGDPLPQCRTRHGRNHHSRRPRFGAAPGGHAANRPATETSRPNIGASSPAAFGAHYRSLSDGLTVGTPLSENPRHPLDGYNPGGFFTSKRRHLSHLCSKHYAAHHGFRACHSGFGCAAVSPYAISYDRWDGPY